MADVVVLDKIVLEERFVSPGSLWLPFNYYASHGTVISYLYKTLILYFWRKKKICITKIGKSMQVKVGFISEGFGDLATECKEYGRATVIKCFI